MKQTSPLAYVISGADAASFYSKNTAAFRLIKVR